MANDKQIVRKLTLKDANNVDVVYDIGALGENIKYDDNISINEKVDSVATDIQSVSSDITTINNRVTEISGDITTLNNRVTEISGQITPATQHTTKSVGTAEGIHNLRYYESKLQYYNGSEWIDISSSSPEPGPGPEPTPTVEIVPFSTGTDDQIAAMLEAYYNDEITWEDMNWSIGDTRTIFLNSMSAPNPNSGSTIQSQYITTVIVDHDHTDLETPINGHSKACITVQTRECIGPCGEGDGLDGTIWINGDSDYDTTFSKWANLYMRTYLNNIVFGAIKNGSFKSAIKSSKHYRHTTETGTQSELVTDYLFLPGYPEIFGTNLFGMEIYSPTNPTEGTQWNYYANGDTTRYIKYGNNNGEPNANKQGWWTGSPSQSYNDPRWGYAWIYVTISQGKPLSLRGDDYPQGLAPAWAM